MKRLLTLLAAAAALAFAAAAPAFADSDPSNDSDAITVRITPAADLGVEIDTAAVTLDFTMAMGETSYTENPVLVTIVGNITPQELNIQGANDSVDPQWSLDADETAAIDELQVYGLFSTGLGAHPAQADFDGVKNLITTTPKRAGMASGAGADENFENNSMSGGTDMDNIPLGATKQLWLRMDAPPYTSTTSEQDFTITVTATRANM
ncbi:MAG: hypothetical protein HYZ75_02030 [Elusimicrobia bacterium]|nr:hypothetical protein [Elusimicrobiota bacterium]